MKNNSGKNEVILAGLRATWHTQQRIAERGIREEWVEVVKEYREARISGIIYQLSEEDTSLPVGELNRRLGTGLLPHLQNLVLVASSDNEELITVYWDVR